MFVTVLLCFLREKRSGKKHKKCPQEGRLEESGGRKKFNENMIEIWA